MAEQMDTLEGEWDGRPQEREVLQLLAGAEGRDDAALRQEEDWKQRARDLESRIETAVARAEDRTLRVQRELRE